jgi:hypothetical protein
MRGIFLNFFLLNILLLHFNLDLVFVFRAEEGISDQLPVGPCLFQFLPIIFSHSNHIVDITAVYTFPFITEQVTGFASQSFVHLVLYE